MKDYSFSGSRSNPYVEQPRTSHRPLVLGILGGLCSLGAIALLLTHSTFSLRVITVDGVTRSSRVSIIEAVQGTLNHRRFWILPGNNFFTANLHDVDEVLRARFPVAQTVLTKKFPSSLIIQITEKQAALVFDNGQSYQALDADGGVVAMIGRIVQSEVATTLVSPVTTSTAVIAAASSTSPIPPVPVVARHHVPNRSDFSKEWQLLPILVNDQNFATSTEAILPSPSSIEAVVAWNTFFQQTLAINPIYFRTLTEDWSQAEIKTKDGFLVYVHLTNDRDTQYASLATLLKQRGGERKKWQYVEVRYPGKIYWK